MILIEQALSLLNAVERLGPSDEEIQREVARQPRFQNIDYPLALPPLFVDAAAVDALRADVEAYVALLEQVVRLYRTDADVRAFFDLDIAAEELIAAEGTPARAITICRLDAYVDRNSGALQILENNADCPAGTLFTPRLNRLIRQLVAPHVAGLAPLLPMDDSEPFTRTLLAAHAAKHGARERVRAIVLQPRGRSNVESGEVAVALSAMGHPCDVVDPRDLELTGDGLMFEGERIDLIWNKINMTAWGELVAAAPQLVDLFARTAAHPAAPVMLNSFGARHVAEAKTSLAFLHAPAFRDRFSAEETALIERLVPWTVRLTRDAELEAMLAAQQQDLVVKQRYDIRGDGVTIGRAVDAEEWRDVIARSWGSGAVVQRYVAPSRYPVRLAGATDVRDLNVSLDSFVFDGKLVGFGAKASDKHKVNLFQGGSKLAVIAVPR